MIKTYVHAALTVLFAFVLAASIMLPAFADHKENHVVCPDGGAWAKTNIDSENSTFEYTAPAGYLLAESCVKAGSQQSTDGNALNLGVYDPPVSSTVLKSATGKGISHYSVRLVERPDPEPTSTPTATPSPEPSVTPTPEPSPTSCEQDGTCDDSFTDKCGDNEVFDYETGECVTECPVGTAFDGVECVSKCAHGHNVTTGECLSHDEPDEPVEELPATGPEDALAVGSLGLCLLGAGTWITRKYGWMN